MMAKLLRFTGERTGMSAVRTQWGTMNVGDLIQLDDEQAETWASGGDFTVAFDAEVGDPMLTRGGMATVEVVPQPDAPVEADEPVDDPEDGVVDEPVDEPVTAKSRRKRADASTIEQEKET